MPRRGHRPARVKEDSSSSSFISPPVLRSRDDGHTLKTFSQMTVTFSLFSPFPRFFSCTHISEGDYLSSPISSNALRDRSRLVQVPNRLTSVASTAVYRCTVR
jgi:hypothetical protein